MRYEAVIFDLDGVLCETDKYHYMAWKSIADKLGIYFDEKINNRLRGVDRRKSLEIILEGYKGSLSEEQKQKLTDEKNLNYRKLLNNLSERDLSEGVKETLDEIKKSGVKMGIGSSSKNAKFILEKLGLNDYFDAISDGTNITHSKPDPEVFLKAAEFLNVEPRMCLVVEDARAGIEAAKNGGMDGAAIGDARKSELADYKLNRFCELKKILDR